MTRETILQTDKDMLRDSLSKYTRKAFHMLPELDKPHILDVGCGSGVPTMELTRLSNGQITGLDINQPLLDRLTRKVEKAGLSDRVKTMNCSIWISRMKASISSGPRAQHSLLVLKGPSRSGDVSLSPKGAW